MVFSVWAALLAGIVATLVMTGLIVMARGMGMTRMPAFELITGSMMSANRGTALVMGAMIHYIVMGTVVFGLIYAALFVAVGTASWLAGLIIGIIHGILVGMMMPMMPSMHPRMQQTPAAVGAAGAGSGGQRRRGEHLPAGDVRRELGRDDPLGHPDGPCRIRSRAGPCLRRPCHLTPAPRPEWRNSLPWRGWRRKRQRRRRCIVHA